MKPVHLWAVFALALIGFGLYMVFSQRLPEPPPAVGALELANGDIERTGSCYTLHDVLVANHFDAQSGHSNVAWNSRVKDEWAMHIENGKLWRTFRFQVEDGRVVPLQVVSSDKLPQIELKPAIDQLLARAAEAHTPKVPRCL
jgi:hypothetical protein